MFDLPGDISNGYAEAHFDRRQREVRPEVTDALNDRARALELLKPALELLLWGARAIVNGVDGREIRFSPPADDRHVIG
jgi:hypothetical protein